ncbi:MocR-like pyridoxine biosynthesis transcription factor PdxR [Siccibacter turicensis]
MKPGYQQIYARYRDNIISGVLKPGDRVPSIRVLAEELKVARKTVETAYAVLIGEGYLTSHGAQGTRVNRDLVLNAAPRPAPPVADAPLPSLTGIRDSLGYLELGIPSLDSFPYKKWLLLAGKAVRAMRPEDMTIPPVMGYYPLRQAIAAYLTVSRGMACTAEQVVITGGYRSNLLWILQALAATRDKVVFEDPGYFFGQKLLKRTVSRLHYAPVDENGINVDYLLQHHADARVVITTPSHQSPLAVTLSLPRKQQLLDWASQNDAWIVEDDYDGEFHYTRKVLPSLKSIDTHDRVIYVGTFSKTVMPSLRIGYMVLPVTTLNAFRESGEIMAGGQPLLAQKILTAFLAEGHFYKHLRKMRTLYQQRRTLVQTALQALYPDIFTLEQTDGGMHIVAYLRSGSCDVELAALWQQHQLNVSPLSSWYSQHNRRFGLIMGYTNVRSEAEARALLSRPRAATLALLNGPPA